MPPPELAAKGVYCTGPECHDLQPKWERPIAELQPPKSSTKNSWPPYVPKADFGVPASPIQFIPAEVLASSNGAKAATASAVSAKVVAKPPMKQLKKSPANSAAAPKKPVKKGTR